MPITPIYASVQGQTRSSASAWPADVRGTKRANKTRQRRKSNEKVGRATCPGDITRVCTCPRLWQGGYQRGSGGYPDENHGCSWQFLLESTRRCPRRSCWRRARCCDLLRAALMVLFRGRDTRLPPYSHPRDIDSFCSAVSPPLAGAIVPRCMLRARCSPLYRTIQKLCREILSASFVNCQLLRFFENLTSKIFNFREFLINSRNYLTLYNSRMRILYFHRYYSNLILIFSIIYDFLYVCFL